MELQVGNKRSFSFSKDEYEILEILDNPNIYMWWTWNSGVCPHCKMKIDREVQHQFYRIEILANKEIKTKDDIIIMGHTLDNRYMQIPVNDPAFNEVLIKSNKYKHLLGTVE